MPDADSEKARTARGILEGLMGIAMAEDLASLQSYVRVAQHRGMHVEVMYEVAKGVYPWAPSLKELMAFERATPPEGWIIEKGALPEITDSI